MGYIIFCVVYVDRFLSLNVLSRHRWFQLLGVGAMLIALWVSFFFSLIHTKLCFLFIVLCVICLVNFSFIICANRKYEEIKPPEVEEYCYTLDNTYSNEEMVIVICLPLVFLNSLALDLLISGLDEDLISWCNEVEIDKSGRYNPFEEAFALLSNPMVGFPTMNLREILITQVTKTLLVLLSIIYVGVRFLTILNIVLKSSTPEGVRETGFSPIKDFGNKRFWLCLLKEVVTANVELM